jgi:urease accessory protein
MTLSGRLAGAGFRRRQDRAPPAWGRPGTTHSGGVLLASLPEQRKGSLQSRHTPPGCSGSVALRPSGCRIGAREWTIWRRTLAPPLLVADDLASCDGMPLAFSYRTEHYRQASMLLTKLRGAILVATGLFATGGTASAHHLMGGKTPSTFAEGILSGVGHPIIGSDHLAFLVALGIAVGVSRISLANPFLFLVAMACGVGAHVAAINIPAAEVVVAASVLLAGALLALDRRIAASGWMAIFTVAGFFHGYAYGESIYGAEPTPLIAYLMGLVAVQTALAVGIALAARSLWTTASLTPRLVGAAISGVGFAVLVAQIIAAP